MTQMASNTFSYCILVILLLRICLVHSQVNNVFDITRFGKPGINSDMTEALEEAWEKACGTENGTVLVPVGSYRVNTVKLRGPCDGTTTFLLNGELTAPENVSNMPDNDGYWVQFRDIQNLAVVGKGSFNGQGQLSWPHNNCKKTLDCDSLPGNINLQNVTEALVMGISSINSKFFHIIVSRSNLIRFENVIVQAPGNSPNTDGIHISQSSNITIQKAWIGTGDDCISISPGSTSVHIYNVTCGPGHGISIGSLGMHKNEGDVVDIVVKNCTFINTQNGARIKTWAPSCPSKVVGVLYEDIILKNVSNSIVIDQHYCPNSHCKAKGESRVALQNVKFKNFRGTSYTKLAVTLDCSAIVPCRNDVVVDGLDILYDGDDVGPTTAVCSNFHGIFSGSISPKPCANYEISPSPSVDFDSDLSDFVSDLHELDSDRSQTCDADIAPTPDPIDELDSDLEDHRIGGVDSDVSRFREAVVRFREAVLRFPRLKAAVLRLLRLRPAEVEA